MNEHELADDLRALIEAGLVVIDNDADEPRLRPTPLGEHVVAQILEEATMSAGEFKASDRTRVALVLGDDVMETRHKDVAIARIVAAMWTPDEREQWYRMWCTAVGLFCSSVDLERVREGRRREMHPRLPLGPAEEPRR